ncbi:MAG TPA: hypothetical protein VH329_03380 [Solirubrobacterales bacterium]|jgi:hypothetical protein
MNDADHIIVNRRDQLGLVVAVVGLVVIGLLAFTGSDIIGSVAGIVQLLIAAGVFILVLAYAIGVLLLEALDNRVGERLTSDFMLVVIPAAVIASALLSLVRA